MATDPKYLPRIYLDTNHWIKLARSALGIHIDPLYSRLYNRIIQLRDSNKLLIPFSTNIFLEIIKQENEQRREKMVDFLVDTSNGWFFQPIERYFKYEILNSCYRKLNSSSYYNVSRDILTNRADSVLCGSIGKIEPKNPGVSIKTVQRYQREWDQYMRDPTVMKQMLKDTFPHVFGQGDAKLMEELAIKIEQFRQRVFQMSDIDRRKAFLLKWILEIFVPDCAKIMSSTTISVTELFTNQRELSSFIENMPALNVLIKLSSARDHESRGRMVQRNDYYDVCHYSIGLAYADIIIGEKMFGSISKRYKLDEKNQCMLFTSLDKMLLCLPQFFE